MSDWDIDPDPDSGHYGSLGYEEHAPRDPVAVQHQTAANQHAIQERSHIGEDPLNTPLGSSGRSDFSRQQVPYDE